MKGSIDQRGDRTFRIRIQLGTDASGKRLQKTVTVHGTKRDAQKKLTELLHEANNGLLVNSGPMTVAGYLDYWLENYVRRLAARTCKNYSEYVEYYIKPHLGNTRLDQLQPAHIQSFYTKLETNGSLKGRGGLSSTTVFNCHRVFKGALKRAVKWRMLGQNPAEAVTPPRPEVRDANILALEQVAAVLEAAEGNQLYIPVLLAICTGMRRGELCGLRWQDINFVEGRLAIRQTLIRVGTAQLEFKSPKTETGKRVVRLPALLIEELQEERKRQESIRGELGPTYNEANLVVCRPDGRYTHPNTLYSNFQKLLMRIGLPRMAIHDLRHSHATHLLEAKVHPKVVSERLGHADPALTLRVYSHVLQDIQHEAARQTDDLLSDAIRKHSALKEDDK